MTNAEIAIRKRDPRRILLTLCILRVYLCAYTHGKLTDHLHIGSTMGWSTVKSTLRKSKRTAISENLKVLRDAMNSLVDLAQTSTSLPVSHEEPEMGAGTTGTGEGGVSSSGRGETRSTSEENHDQYRMQREVSLSAADEDAALTLLSARHMGGGQVSRPLAWPERQSSDSSAQQQPNQQQSGRSKRIPKPKLRHKNDIGGFEQYSYRRHHHAGGRSATHGQTKKLEQMERHLASITIGKKAGEPVDMDDILLRHGNGTTSAFDLEHISNDFTTVVNLADYSQQDLKGMARKSGQHSMLPTLQPLPGVPMEKVATFSGQDLFYKSSIQSHYRPSRTSRSILSPDVLKSDEERKAVAEKIVEKWAFELLPAVRTQKEPCLKSRRISDKFDRFKLHSRH
jgi:hypothetical protein